MNQSAANGGIVAGDRRHTLAAWFARPVLWEGLAWLTLSVAWIWLLAAGDQNGIGYFQQPRNDLVLPLVAGGIVNAATFWANTFVAIPRLLIGGAWLKYLSALVALFAANVVLQTVVQLAIIHTVEPSLQSLSIGELAIENCYLPPFVLIFSALYRFARDWVVNIAERRRLEGRAAALEHALNEARSALQTTGVQHDFLFVSAGASKRQIPMKTIKYIKAAGNYAEIVTTDGTHLAYGALKVLIDSLPPGRFVRIHRSYIAGLDHVSSIEGGQVHIGGEELPIGAAFRKSLAERWNARASGAA